MVQYRRNRIAGGSYFFTVTLRDRHARLLTAHIDALRESFRTVRARHPFTLDAVVVLPEHLHAVCTLPAADADYSGRLRRIKAMFTRALVTRGVPLHRDSRGEYALWQRRFWEHTIRDEDDLRRHVDYIHFNPVKHGLVRAVQNWPHSSFHRYVKQGLLPADWGGLVAGENSGSFGEPPTHSP
jgi:putative transposase